MLKSNFIGGLYHLLLVSEAQKISVAKKSLVGWLVGFKQKINFLEKNRCYPFVFFSIEGTHFNGGLDSLLLVLWAQKISAAKKSSVCWVSFQPKITFQQKSLFGKKLLLYSFFSVQFGRVEKKNWWNFQQGPDTLPMLCGITIFELLFI